MERPSLGHQLAEQPGVLTGTSGDSFEQIHLGIWCRSADEPWSSVTANTSVQPSRPHAVTYSGRTTAILSNAATESFTRYRWIPPPPSECSTLPLGDKLPSDSGYGTVQSAPRLSIGNTSVFGDNNTDTQSLAGNFSNFQLQTNNQTPLNALYNSSNYECGTGNSAHGPQAVKQDANPLACRYCDVGCKTKSQLKKHMQQHIKLYRCRIPRCSYTKGFSTQNDLDRHTRSKHPTTNASGRWYRCYLGACKNKPKNWPRADNFRQHLNRKHKDEVEHNDLEPFVVIEGTRTANEIVGSELAADAETDYLDCEPLGLDLSNVGQDLWGSQNHQAPWATDTSDPTREDDLQHVGGEKAQHSFNISVVDVGGQFTDFSPTILNSPDVDLHSIDRRPVDLDIRELFTGSGVPKRSLMNARESLAPILLPRPETVSFADQTSFEDHDILFLGLSSLPQTAINLAELGDNCSSKLGHENNNRLSLETLTEVYAQDGGENISAGSEEAPDNLHISGETDAPQDSSFPIGPGSTWEFSSDPQATAFESYTEVSNATVSLAEKCSVDGEKDEVYEDEDSFQSKKTMCIATLKAGDLDDILKKYGYHKIPARPSPSQAMTRKMSSGGLGTEGNSNVKCDEPKCQKTFNRECELRKHKKRHDKPYGCTFVDCNSKFGSKSDWKRHENSQHEHLDGWRCDIQVHLMPGRTTEATATTMHPCGKQCHRRETFKAHLQRDHILSESEVGRKLEQCRYEKECGSRFWCGFCVAIVDVGSGGGSSVSSRGGRKKVADGGCTDGGWTERYDHIDDHLFGRRSLPKKRIEEWRHAEGEGKRNRRQRRPTTNGDMSTPTHWRCCYCHNHHQVGVTTRCVSLDSQCEHDQCEYCDKFQVDVAA